MPDTTWEPSEAKLEGGLVVFLERVGKRIVDNDKLKTISKSGLEKMQTVNAKVDQLIISEVDPNC